MTAQRLVIAGASGFGRELHTWVKSSPEWAKRNSVGEIVFIDDKIPQIPVRARIVSTMANYRPREHDLVICAIGSPDVRKAVVSALQQHSVRFATFVHDRAVIGDNVELGAGVVVCPDALLSSDIRVADQVHINVRCAIGHDVSIGEFATLSAGCNLAGNVAIGEMAFLATAVTVIPGKQIGPSSYIGAGSVVIKNVPAGVTVFGNPSAIVGRKLK